MLEDPLSVLYCHKIVRRFQFLHELKDANGNPNVKYAEKFQKLLRVEYQVESINLGLLYTFTYRSDIFG